MRATSAAIALIGALTLSACDKKDAEPAKPAAPATQAPSTPPAPPATESSFTGTLEAQGITTTMQGTHKLVEGGKTVCLLGSKTVDLKAYEGKRVKVTGLASPTVEPSPTPYVDVSKVEAAP